MGNDSWNPTDPNKTTDDLDVRSTDSGTTSIFGIAMRHCMCKIERLIEEIERLKGLPDD